MIDYKFINSYTVTIVTNENKDIFNALYNKSYVNDLDNNVKNNKAINGAIDVLSEMNEEELIGILVVRQLVKFYDDKDLKPECDSFLDNIYSHIYNDQTNWVTVKEAKQFLMNMKV
jgi:hypothetical protein